MGRAMRVSQETRPLATLLRLQRVPNREKSTRAHGRASSECALETDSFTHELFAMSEVKKQEKDFTPEVEALVKEATELAKVKAH